MSLFLFPFPSIGYVMLLCFVSPLIKCTVVWTDRSASVYETGLFQSSFIHSDYVPSKALNCPWKKSKFCVKLYNRCKLIFHSVYMHKCKLECIANKIVIFFWITHISLSDDCLSFLFLWICIIFIMWLYMYLMWCLFCCPHIHLLSVSCDFLPFSWFLFCVFVIWYYYKQKKFNLQDTHINTGFAHFCFLVWDLENHRLNSWISSTSTSSNESECR